MARPPLPIAIGFGVGSGIFMAGIVLRFAYPASELGPNVETPGIALLVLTGLIWHFRTGRLRGKPLHPDGTGETLQPAPFPGAFGPQTAFVGGCNVPIDGSRVNATFPLGLLEVTAGSASLRSRPRWLTSVTGTRGGAFFTPAPDLTIKPVISSLGTPGISFQRGREPVWIFWTNEREQALSALAWCGFTVVWQETRGNIF